MRHKIECAYVHICVKDDACTKSLFSSGYGSCTRLGRYEAVTKLPPDVLDSSLRCAYSVQRSSKLHGELLHISLASRYVVRT